MLESLQEVGLHCLWFLCNMSICIFWHINSMGQKKQRLLNARSSQQDFIATHIEMKQCSSRTMMLQKMQNYIKQHRTKNRVH